MIQDRYLEELQDPGRALSAAKLLDLSGLSKAELEQLRSAWEQIAPARRQELLSRMAEIAEDDPTVDFNAVYRLALTDPEETVRLEAIDALWECQDRWLVDELLDLMESDDALDVRAAAASNLGKFSLLGELQELADRDATRVRQALLGVLGDGDESIEVRRRALEAISPFSDEAINDLIRDAYHSPDQRMKASAVYSMGMHCDPAWLPVLLTELRSPLAEMRFEAARACGEMEDERATGTLAEAARDPDRQVQRSAIEALGRVGGNVARRVLKNLLTDDDPVVQEAAREALEELDSSENPFSFNYHE